MKRMGAYLITCLGASVESFFLLLLPPSGQEPVGRVEPSEAGGVEKRA